MNNLISPRLIQAIEFSAKAHKKQERLVSGVPYISHPFTVAMILAKAGYSEDVIIAGILHDVVEDTEIAEGTIEKLLGSTVSEMVLLASENKLINSRPERKAEHIERILKASDNAKAIIAADMLHNRLCALIELKSGKTKEDIALVISPEEYISEGKKKFEALKTLNDPIVQELEAVLEEIDTAFES